MGATFYQKGETLRLTAPTGGVTKDVPVVIGTKVVIPLETAAETVKFEAAICGVHKVTKAASQEWAELAAVYWDATNGCFTTSSSGNTAAGVAAAYVSNAAGATTGYVLLNGLPG